MMSAGVPPPTIGHPRPPGHDLVGYLDPLEVGFHTSMVWGIPAPDPSSQAFLPAQLRFRLRRRGTNTPRKARPPYESAG
jgi:hypothetical protein